MSNTSVTIRMDESLKTQLQDLLSDLGMDMTTFFIVAARQAVREQALPFRPDRNGCGYDRNAYKMAIKNTNYDINGRVVLPQEDEWTDETEWDEMFEQMKKERKNEKG